MKDAVIIGAGLAGLQCAVTLESAGLDVAVFEASDAPGGRVRTDLVDGFLLDRGFQVLLTAYPEAQRAFDYATLDLKALKPGALIWHGGQFHRFADPFREPFAAVQTLLDPIVPLGDKFRIARLRARVTNGQSSDLFAHEETTTRSYLERYGFSPPMIAKFFQPFFGGVFLENQLSTSSRYFEFLFRMFSVGTVAVPAAGMQALPDQLAARLRPDTLEVHCRVESVYPKETDFSIRTLDGRSFRAKNVVLATAESELLQGLGVKDQFAPAVWNRTTTFYFAADRSPLNGPILALNGEGPEAGPVNNAVVMSEVSRSYAPPGMHLISASVVGEAPDSLSIGALEQRVRAHLKVWFGAPVDDYRLLRPYPIEHALPLQSHADWQSSGPRLDAVPGLYRAGDITETASIQGALVSGRRAAEALLADLGFAS
jgi:phytoene dehydrogenase-like protein